MFYKHPAWWFPSISLHSCVTRKRKNIIPSCTFFMPFWITSSSVSAAREHSQCCTQPSCEMRYRLSCSRAQTEIKCEILCLNAAPEQSRGTCAKASHSFLWSWTPAAFLTLCDPSNQTPEEREIPDTRRDKAPNYCLLKSQCLVSITVFDNVMILFCYLCHEGHKFVLITRCQTNHSTHPFSGSSALLG